MRQVKEEKECACPEGKQVYEKETRNFVSDALSFSGLGPASWAVSDRTWGQSKLLRTRLGQKPFPGMQPLPQIVKSPPRAACQGRIDH